MLKASVAYEYFTENVQGLLQSCRLFLMARFNYYSDVRYIYNELHHLKISSISSLISWRWSWCSSSICCILLKIESNLKSEQQRRQMPLYFNGSRSLNSDHFQWVTTTIIVVGLVVVIVVVVTATVSSSTKQ